MEGAVVVTKNTLRDNLLYKGVLMVGVELDYPQINGALSKQARHAFNRYYALEANERMTYARTTLLRNAIADYQQRIGQGYPFNSYTLDQTFETTLNQPPLVSLYYDVYEYTGGAHGNTTRTGNTWDLRLARMIKLNELFRPGYDYMSVIAAYIAQEAHRREASGEGYFFDNLDQNLVQYFDPANFYLTPEGLAIFYPLYTISPYVGGINVFEVPYGLFGNNLRYPLIQFR